MFERIGYLQIIPEHFIVFNFERLNSRALPLGRL